MEAKRANSLKLPGAAARGPARRRDDARPAHGTAGDDLRELIAASLWPMVSAAFRDVDEEVEACFFQLDDMQVVVSRHPVRGSARKSDDDRRVTLEVWPAIGPRLLQIEWSGQRPYVIHRREGDWLPRLIRASRTLE